MVRRSPSAAERALWEAAMRDVRRFRYAPPASLPRAMSAEPTALAAFETKPRRLDPPCASVRGGVDRPTLDRLRRGRVAVEARIDLHGMTQKAAFAALMGFVDTSARVGRRAILVITGKGALGQGGGVLRRNVPAWLAASPVAGRILTIVPAHLRHGGDGAFYVILRRDRRGA